jgi:hypothetical protein
MVMAFLLTVPSPRKFTLSFLGQRPGCCEYNLFSLSFLLRFTAAVIMNPSVSSVHPQWRENPIQLKDYKEEKSRTESESRREFS